MFFSSEHPLSLVLSAVFGFPPSVLLNILNKPQDYLCPRSSAVIIQYTKLGIAELMQTPAHLPWSFLITQTHSSMWENVAHDDVEGVDDCGHRVT